MSSSRVNLIGLATALIAGLVDFSLPQTLLSSVAGLTLLVALFAYDEDRATRTSSKASLLV